MLGLFGKKSEKDKLYNQYEKLLKDAHIASTSNRRLSDDLMVEANEILKKIEEIEKNL